MELKKQKRNSLKDLSFNYNVTPSVIRNKFISIFKISIGDFYRSNNEYYPIICDAVNLIRETLSHSRQHPDSVLEDAFELFEIPKETLIHFFTLKYSSSPLETYLWEWGEIGGKEPVELDENSYLRTDLIESTKPVSRSVSSTMNISISPQKKAWDKLVEMVEQSKIN